MDPWDVPKREMNDTERAHRDSMKKVDKSTAVKGGTELDEALELLAQRINESGKLTENLDQKFQSVLRSPSPEDLPEQSNADYSSPRAQQLSNLARELNYINNRLADIISRGEA